MNDLWKWVGEQTGNILGVAGLVTGFIFWWISRRPKLFGWQVISQTAILNDASRDMSLKVVFEDNTVSHPNIVVVRLGNVGKSPITAADFDGPASIEFPESIILAGTGVGYVKEFTRTSTRLEFIPSLLNSGEWVEFKFVTDGKLTPPAITARIAGHNGPLVDVARSKRRFWRPIAFASLAMVSLGAGAIAAFEDIPVRVVSLILGGIAVLVLSMSIKRTSIDASWTKKSSNAEMA